MNTQSTDTQNDIPISNEFKFPGMPYILGVQKPESANNDTDPYGLFIGVSVNQSEEYNGLIITPPKQSDIDANTEVSDIEVINFAGGDLSFDSEGNLLKLGNRYCHIKECIIGVDNSQKYIYLLHYNKAASIFTKLWTLPPNIFSLLYLDRVPFNYSFMINDNEQCMICKIKLPSYIHDSPSVVDTSLVKLKDNVTFNCNKCPDQKETLENSYFVANSEKIYFKDIAMNPDKDNKNILLKRGDDILGICAAF